MAPAPAVGRIVHVITRTGADPAPAIITRVWGPSAHPGVTTVNLRAFHDANPGEWQEHLTSVLVWPSRDAMQAACQIFGAFWPPRAEDTRDPGARPPRY